MKSRQQRLDSILLEMNRLDTLDLVLGELPLLISIAKIQSFSERPQVLEHVLQKRGAIPQPSERPSERAMRLAQEKSLNEKKGLDRSG